MSLFDTRSLRRVSRPCHVNAGLWLGTLFASLAAHGTKINFIENIKEIRNQRQTEWLRDYHGTGRQIEAGQASTRQNIHTANTEGPIRYWKRRKTYGEKETPPKSTSVTSSGTAWTKGRSAEKRPQLIGLVQMKRDEKRKTWKRGLKI